MPQVYVHGELIGGSDIALEMMNDGSLKEMFEAGKSKDDGECCGSC
jgi:glutaredoxin-related protein